MPQFHAGRLAPTLLAVFLAAACVSEPKKDTKLGKPEPYVPLKPEGPVSIGYFLTRFDRSLAQWSQYKLASASPKDQNALHGLEENMRERAKERRDEIVTELQSGSPVNRRIAAAALGFTGDPTVLGPLLAVLDEHDPELVQKALLALGVLAMPETPLGGILQRLHDDPESWTRNNAAFAVLSIARAGNTSKELSEGCQLALEDPMPGVRAQCASTLGVIADPTAVKPLSALLFDEANLVALAAATALANIGRAHAEQKGSAARALSGALDQVKADRRLHLLGALRWLAGTDYGEDSNAWLEWAHRMP